MSIDMMLVIGGIVLGLGYFSVRSRRKQRQVRDQARRAAG
jgi:hypothetical protein